MKPTKTQSPVSSRLLAYSSLAIGSTAMVSTQSEAATVIDVNATTFNTGLSAIGTVGFSAYYDYYYGDIYTVTFTSAVRTPTGYYFRRDSDSSTVNHFAGGTFNSIYFQGSANYSYVYGAEFNSANNWFYAIGHADTNQRIWLQFSFGEGDGTATIVKAVLPSFVGELPSAAAAAAVPEPSALMLLSLGASGLLVRRRKAA